MHKYIPETFSVFLFWLIGWALGAWLFSGLSSRAYAPLFAWWFVAYFSQAIAINGAHIFLTIAFGFTISLSLSLFEFSILYKEAAHAGIYRLIVIAFGHALVVVSPLAFTLLIIKTDLIKKISVFIRRKST